MSLTMPNGRPTPMDPQAAMSNLRGYAQTQYGQNVSDADFQGYANEVGYTGGQVSDDQFQRAKTSIDKKYKKPAPEGPPPPQATNPTPLPQNYQPFQPQVNNVVGSILQNPHTMGQRWQDQQFEGQKEQAIAYQKQLGDQAKQRTAGRGWSQQGGVNQAILGGIDENLMSSLLAGRRDIGQQAAIQNRSDEIGAVNLAHGLQQDVNQGNLARWSAEEQARTGQQSFGLQNWLAQTGNILEQQRLAEQMRQFNSGYGLDLGRFFENQRQFNTTFGEGQRQFNNTLGLNWFNAGNNQSNTLLDYFLRSNGL